MNGPMRVVDVDRLDCRLVAHRWRYAEETAAEMDRHWAMCAQKNPALYDGPILLACRAETRTATGGAHLLELDFFETRFSRFLAWRDFGWADKSVFNAFSMPAVRSSDGAYLLGEMGPGHSSAGQIYFPGGTPDLSDIVDGGHVDLNGSLVRELAEETGLKAQDGCAAPGWTIVFDHQRVACLKSFDWDESAARLRQNVQNFLAGEKNPELRDAHFLSRAEELADPRLPRFMIGYLGKAFGGNANASGNE